MTNSTGFSLEIFYLLIISFKAEIYGLCLLNALFFPCRKWTSLCLTTT